MKQKGRFKGIFWLDASSRYALESSMLSVCKLLLPERLVGNPRDAVDLDAALGFKRPMAIRL